MTAPVQALTIPNPAFNGLAKQRQQVPMGPEWATKALNVVIDGAGRLGSRKGWQQVNASAISGTPTIRTVHEYVNAAGSSALISAGPTQLFVGTTTPTDITGAITTPTAGNYQFVNFNGKCLGWQASHAPIVYTGTGNFAEIVAGAGTLPNGNSVLAAYGRVWATDDDEQTIRYSALLDETDWSTASGGGSIDMRNVWTKGMDTVVGIRAYGSSLIVFGKRHIVIWVDGSGSEIGMDPQNIYVGQVIENVGLVARDAVALAGEQDVLFWSFSGVRSLRRTLQETATPVNEISPMNRDALRDSVSVGDLTKVRAVYSAKEGYFLIIHPDDNQTYCFDAKGVMEGDTLRTTTWSLVPTAACETALGTLYFGFAGGLLGQYGSYADNGSSYRWEYESGWIPLEPAARLKMMKRLKGYFFSPASGNVTFKWWTDFKSNLRSVSRFLEGNGDYWNEDEWSLMEWSGGRAYHEKFVALSHKCEYFKFGLLFVIDGQPFGVQSLTLYYEPTRLV